MVIEVDKKRKKNVWQKRHKLRVGLQLLLLLILLQQKKKKKKKATSRHLKHSTTPAEAPYVTHNSWRESVEAVLLLNKAKGKEREVNLNFAPQGHF